MQRYKARKVASLRLVWYPVPSNRLSSNLVWCITDLIFLLHTRRFGTLCRKQQSFSLKPFNFSLTRCMCYRGNGNGKSGNGWRVGGRSDGGDVRWKRWRSDGGDVRWKRWRSDGGEMRWKRCSSGGGEMRWKRWRSDGGDVRWKRWRSDGGEMRWKRWRSDSGDRSGSSGGYGGNRSSVCVCGCGWREGGQHVRILEANYKLFLTR